MADVSWRRCAGYRGTWGGALSSRLRQRDSQAARLALWIEEKSRSYAAFFPFSGAQAVRSSALVTRIEGGMGTLSIPERAQLIVNRVLVPGESTQQACSQMEQWIEEALATGLLRHVDRGGSLLVRPRVSLRPRPTPPLLPYLISPKIRLLTAWAALETHCPVEWGMGVSVADENRFGGELHKPVVPWAAWRRGPRPL